MDELGRFCGRGRNISAYDQAIGYGYPEASPTAGTPGHAFYRRLNQLLGAADFDKFLLRQMFT